MNSYNASNNKCQNQQSPSQSSTVEESSSPTVEGGVNSVTEAVTRFPFSYHHQQLGIDFFLSLASRPHRFPIEANVSSSIDNPSACKTSSLGSSKCNSRLLTPWHLLISKHLICKQIFKSARGLLRVNLNGIY
ncbi:hypothetical protein GQ457_12G009140 [Hibiscus cannabinus]